MADDFIIPRKAFTSFVSTLINGYPNPEDPDPPGPWGPVIRRALERIRLVAGPHPDPWSWAALNPQPLPPRLAFVVAFTRETIEKVSSLHELAEALPEDAQGHAQQAASGLMARFIDDCGNGRIPPWRRWPFPWPPRREEMEEAINPAELVVIGAQLAAAASTVASERLQRDLGEAGNKLMEAGLAQM